MALNPQRGIFLCVLSCSVLSVINAGFGEVSQDARELLNKIISRQQLNRKWLQSVGSGVLEYVRPDGSEQATWDVQFTVKEKKVLIHYVLRREISKRPEFYDFDAVRILADGEVIVTALFSPRIHPTGCEAESRTETPDYRRAANGIDLDIRRILVAPLLRSEKVLEMLTVNGVAVTRVADAADTLMITYDNGTYWKVESSAAPDYHIVRAELGTIGSASVPSMILEYDWAAVADGFRPSSITMHKYAVDLKEGYDIYRLTLDELNAEADVDDSQFSMTKLQLCERARLIDRRKDAKFKVRNIDLDSQIPAEP